ncbi:hypothetical protein [Nonomuraea africana]|uniref:PE domain-containing protein n=1 Tax=Nonomuraea africana TaxID=46171 RepID=A0ABR9KUA8_9ACTN|nr:hypothetical protein [Nonomuraea africana]MBE1565619.1 hypothetical protein [Nonomuraea africana]
MKEDVGGTPPPEVELTPNWEGLDPDVERYLEHDSVRDAARGLRKELSDFEGAAPGGGSATWTGTGTFTQFEVLGNVGPRETGAWETATYFGENIAQAYEVMFTKYKELVGRIEVLGIAIEKAVDNTDQGHKDSSA